MDFSNHTILLGGALLLISVLASLFSARTGMPLLLAFLILGMLMGEEGPGGVRFDDVATAHLIGSLALAVILLDGGLRTESASFRVGLRPAVTLATLGVVLTAAVTGALATWLLEIHWLQGLLIGAIVGSTDAAAVFSLLHSHGLRIKERVGATLEIESGSNDPMAIFLTIALVELLAKGGESLSWTLLSGFVVQIGLGAAAGLAGGYLMVKLVNRLQLAAGLYPLLALAGGLVTFGIAALFGGSGFLAIYIVGLLMGNRPMQASGNIRRFHDGIAWLSQIAMFLVLGLLVTPSELLPVAPQALLLAAGLMFLARPLAVGLCLLPFRFPWREQVYIGWVGLRGAVPIVLALFPLLAGIEQAATIFNVVFFVVLISLVVQGWTVAPAARWLGLELPPTAGALHRVELDLPGRHDYELVGYRLAADSQAAGLPLRRLPLPQQTHIAAVLRGDRLLGCEEPELTLAVGDHVYLFAGPTDIKTLDRLFVTVQAPRRLDERRFFGEFVLQAEVRLADVVAMYGFQVPDALPDETLRAYLERHFPKAVVGDRLRVGNSELVVREVEEGRVSRVGLKLAV